MIRRTLVLLLALAPLPVLAQQAPATAAAPAKAVKDADLEKLTKAIAASYYHPADLGGTDCAISLDWVTFLGQMKMDTSTDQAKEALHKIQAMKIHSHAERSKLPDVTFDWNGAEMPNKEQLEFGLKQAITGFYQFYWSTFELTSLKPAEITKVESLADGGSNIHAEDGNSSVEIRVNADNVPVHYAFDVPGSKGFFDVLYAASDNPKPGDVRRISEVRVTQQVGVNTTNVNLKLDYQPADSYFIPHHVTFEIPGAYTMPFEFTSCTVSKIVQVPAN